MFPIWPACAHLYSMTNLKRSCPKLRWLFVPPLVVPFAAVLATGLFVAGAHARYGLIRATTITIETPDQVEPGETYDVRIHAAGFPFGAGVEVSGDANRGRSGIEPITRGWNSFRVAAPTETGFYALTARLYAVDEGDPSVCEILKPSRVTWMPPSAMCLSYELDQARARIEIVSTR